MKFLVITLLVFLFGSSLAINEKSTQKRAEFIGTEGNDLLGGGSDNDYFDGLGGLDTIDGGSGDDHIEGGLGEDNLIGSAGNDLIRGGNDSDIIYGLSGDDEIYGDRGSDYIEGGSGDDYLDGGPDYDTIIGGDGNDTLVGGPAHDVLYGDSGDDYLDGGIDNDYLDGGDGKDSLFGGLDMDILIGGEEDDILNGEEGDDDLRGGRGKDYLIGGPGDDFLSGDEHPDTYEFSGFFGHDRVYIGSELDYPGVAIFAGSNPQHLLFRQDNGDLIVTRHYSKDEDFFPHYDSVRFLGWFAPQEFQREVHLFYTTLDSTWPNHYTTSDDAQRLTKDMSEAIVWKEDLSLEDIINFYSKSSVSSYWYCNNITECQTNNGIPLSAQMSVETAEEPTPHKVLETHNGKKMIRDVDENESEESVEESVEEESVEEKEVVFKTISIDADLPSEERLF